MSDFTPVSSDEARALLAHFTLGELESLEGIAQDIENTNYFLDTTTGRYVLTHFEKIPREDLPFYVGLMHHLAKHEIHCPAPMALQEGGFLAEVAGKPAVIVTRLPGDEALALLTDTLTGGDPVIIDILTRLDDPKSGAHFAVLTGLAIDAKNPNAVRIFYNDPLTGRNRSGDWHGGEGIWNAWKNNRDPGGSGWWMVIASP